MDTYPTLPQVDGTALVPRTGVMERIATNGAVRSRAYQSADKNDAQIDHGLLTSAQLATFKSFYAAHRAVEFFWTAAEDGVQRVCTFVGGSPYSVTPSGGLFQLRVNLREV